MSKGSGALGFGGGLARGLANALLTNRQRKDQKARDDQQKKDDFFKTILPIAMQNVEDVSLLEPLFRDHFPDQFGEPGKKGKNKDGDSLLQMLGHFMGVGRQKAGDDLPEDGGITGHVKPSQQPEGVTGGTINSTSQPAGVSGGILGNQPQTAGQPQAEAPHTLFGIPIMSPAQRTQRQVDALDTEVRAKVDLARRMLPVLQSVDPTATMDDALATVGIKTPGATARAGGTPPQVGSFGDEVQRREAFLRRPMTQDELRTFRVQYDQDLTKAGMTFGVDREALAQAVFNGKSYAELGPDEQAVVIAEEQKQLQAEARNRALGTGRGRFETPADLNTAQDTGVTVGTSAADVAGQNVPKADVAERRRSLQVLKGDLVRIKELLGVLPSETTLAGAAPGGVLAVRRRMNTDSGLKDADGNALSYRSAVGQLESVLDNMVNVLARARAEQRGTQTERDAERAYNAVVNLQAGLLNPLGGDTQESARARINETMEGLDRVLAGLPTVPSAQAKPGAAAAPKGADDKAPTGTGMVIKDGKVYIGGKLAPGQK